ncbi:hypothetical protein SMW60_003375 [Escherichia albertii]|uniref:hypothetical protein n=1 Tax=Escherichia albertii TaxID=208962 RepID=UPI0021D3F70C|nr:hypothetical protein [Escherichia albertii]EFO0999372.1 hypothetical protein [Escherichia albertii]ELY3288139.1 hypothetical protein [Escherichia albertii]MCU7310013.1 hypothetical protein [Escherichia albertii]MCZ8811160.1 hypothetical protein [Escherichia albertii]
MHYRNVVCLLSYSLFLSSAWGCRLDEPEHNVYQQQGKGVVYLRPYEETNLFLSGVNYKRLRRLPNLLIDPKTLDEWDEIPPLTDLTTDYLYEGAQAWFPHYAYHSDGRYILYAGKVVQNPPDKPLVDVASFKAWGDFAADKNSLYFRGKRADSNGGENSLDIKTLHQVKFPHPWKPDFLGLILRDAKFLYVDGHRLADPDSFRVLAQKSWDQRGKFSTAFNPCVAVPFGPWDTLARTQTKIMINGEQLNADPETFTVVRWMPGSLLSWRDKSGLHRKVLNQGNLDKDMAKNCATFGVQEHDVSWRKGPKCQQEILPGLDPEQFHPLSKTVAQYQDKLYVIKKTEFGENKLDIVTLDNPNLVIDKRFNAGRTHGYLLTKLPVDGEEEDSLQVFESSGPLILLDYRVPGEREAHLGDSPHYKKWYAHDDRYVYAFDGSQLWRYPTPNTKAVRVKWKTEHSGYGYWADYRSGELDGRLLENGTFIPTGIPYDSSVKATQYSDINNAFLIGETDVRWRKLHSTDQQWSQWEKLPDIDPKEFHPITDRVAQYKNSLYIAKLSPFGKDYLETIELDSPISFLKQRINAGENYGYFMRSSRLRDDIQVFAIDGPLKTTKRFAYDNHYVYTWIGSQLYRTASPCPAKTRNLDQNMFSSNDDIIILKTGEECRKTADGQTLKP